jgi:hypothetical protein
MTLFHDIFVGDTTVEVTTREIKFQVHKSNPGSGSDRRFNAE